MKTYQKPYKFNLDDKGQRLIGIMNGHDAWSHGDTPMCHIW